jgi:phospholipase A1/A2
MTSCMEQAMASADDTTTMGELRRRCQQQTLPVRTAPVAASKTGPLEKRLAKENENVLSPFTIMPHKPNYLLVGAYNAQGYDAQHFQRTNRDPSLEFDKIEAQFQISIKTPLFIDLFSGNMDVYAGYTNHSFWQVYNDDISSPFRETNHEPEAWVQFNPGWNFFGLKNTWNSFGINHQSNGQSGDLSRSWNRLLATFTFEYGNLGLGVSPWVRIPEDESTDDNPDITDYLGHYEILISYRWDDHVVSLMTRNNVESGFSRGAMQTSWSFPLGDWPFLKGYVQLFNGYGESLIDYDQYVNRVGVGLSLTDWL